MNKYDYFKQGKYDMEAYWDKRAECFDEDEYKAICVFLASREINMFWDYLHHQALSFLLRKIGNVKAKRVLEIGCGVGRWADFINRRGASYTGIDISQNMVDIAKKRAPEAEFFKMSADALDFGDESFDLVFSVAVLHHVPYEVQQEAIKQMCRVTHNGGHIIIMENIIMEDTRQHKDFPFNMFPNSAARWKALFEGNGCKVNYSLNHKCWLTYRLFSRLSELVGNVRLTRGLNRIIIRIFGLLEVLFSRVLTQKHFSGVGIIFEKVEAVSTGRCASKDAIS